MKELIDYLSGRVGIANRHLLEKDIILQRILLRLMQTPFRKEFAFKGGTCLIKCFLGYFRFSEDLDFTFIGQREFRKKSQKEVRRMLSSRIDSLLALLEGIAQELGLDFKKGKANRRYVELGGSGKFATFKLWYTSGILETEQFIKIQVNFVELIACDIIENTARGLYQAIPEKEMRLLHPGYEDIIQEVKLQSYSLTEILFEKIRAILTRRGLKSRDFIDSYLIQKKIKVDLGKEEPRIMDKIRFMLQYDKYVQNLSAIRPEEVVLGEEEKLLLEPVDEGFRTFLPAFSTYLKGLEKKLKNQE